MITVLRSGSKGCMSVIYENDELILIDFGISFKVFSDFLNKEAINIDKVKINIIISHTHSDHIKGLKTLKKLKKVNIYSMKENINFLSDYSKMEVKDINDFQSNHFILRSFPLSHDKPNIGLLIKGYKEIVHITDTGYINSKYHKLITNKNVYILEFNHDVNRLLEGSYPIHLKQRIMSDSGHLSNHDALRYLKLFKGNNTTDLFLAHISDTNNDRKFLYNYVKKNVNDISIHLTYEDKESDII